MDRRAGVALVSILIAGCASASPSAFDPLPTPHFAAHAHARIVVAHTESGDCRVRLSVGRLPPPERLGLDLSNYTVWIVPRGARPIAAGRLRYDRRRGHGDFVVRTRYERFRLMVTAEPGLRSGRPSPVIVVDRTVAG